MGWRNFRWRDHEFWSSSSSRMIFFRFRHFACIWLGCEVGPGGRRGYAGGSPSVSASELKTAVWRFSEVRSWGICVRDEFCCEMICIGGDSDWFVFSWISVFLFRWVVMKWVKMNRTEQNKGNGGPMVSWLVNWLADWLIVLIWFNKWMKYRNMWLILIQNCLIVWLVFWWEMGGELIVQLMYEYLFSLSVLTSVQVSDWSNVD